MSSTGPGTWEGPSVGYGSVLIITASTGPACGREGVSTSSTSRPIKELGGHVTVTLPRWPGEGHSASPADSEQHGFNV